MTYIKRVVLIQSKKLFKYIRFSSQKFGSCQSFNFQLSPKKIRSYNFSKHILEHILTNENLCEKSPNPMVRSDLCLKQKLVFLVWKSFFSLKNDD